MAWDIKYRDGLKRTFKNIDQFNEARIRRFLENRVATLDNPKAIAKKLVGSNNKDLWRYRVGDYRVVIKFEDNELIILVIEIDHRKNIYR